VINEIRAQIGGVAVTRRLMAVAAFILPLVLAAVLYAPSIGFDYVWDDRVLFVESETLRLGDLSWANVTRPLFETSVYVRPFAILTYMVQFKLFGPTPEIAHAVNIGLHLANIAMVMALAWMHCTRRQLGSVHASVLVAGTVYALHPALVEPVVWASGRFDLLATTCVLAALVADIKIKSPMRRASAVATAFALGLGSKEVAATLPLLLIAQRAALDPASAGTLRYVRDLLIKEKWTVALCIVVAAVYVLVRMGATTRFMPPVSVSESLTTLSTRLAYVLDTIGFYLQQGLAPWWGESVPLHPANADAVLSPSRLPRIFAGFAFSIVVLIGLKQKYYAGWMSACAFAALLPVLNIVILPLADNIGCDRFLTLPLTFAALAVAGIDLSRHQKHASAAAVVVTFVLALWIFGAIGMIRATLPRWENDLALWTWLYGNPQTQSAAEGNFMATVMREGRYDLAHDALKRRLQKGPLEAEQQVIYGLALAHCGEPEEGLAYITGAMRAYPPIPYAPANFREEQGAFALFRDRLGYAHFAIAEAMILLGKTGEALEASEEAARYRPGMLEGLVVRSALRQGLGKPDSDTASLREALGRAHPAERRRLERKREELLRFAARGEKVERKNPAAWPGNCVDLGGAVAFDGPNRPF
jgi:tetratricopeptide (TPR) repeat protein